MAGSARTAEPPAHPHTHAGEPGSSRSQAPLSNRTSQPFTARDIQISLDQLSSRDSHPSTRPPLYSPSHLPPPLPKSALVHPSQPPTQPQWPLSSEPNTPPELVQPLAFGRDPPDNASHALSAPHTARDVRIAVHTPREATASGIAGEQQGLQVRVAKQNKIAGEQQVLQLRVAKDMLIAGEQQRLQVRVAKENRLAGEQRVLQLRVAKDRLIAVEQQGLQVRVANENRMAGEQHVLQVRVTKNRLIAVEQQGRQVRVAK